MGMYTEIVVKISLVDSLDEKTTKILEYLFGEGEEIPKEDLPDHEFFTKERWDFIGHCSSYYHHPVKCNSIVYDKYTKGREYYPLYIFSRSDIKDYSGEIKSFFDWIDQYVDSPSGQCIGYSWYEEESQPTLVFKK